MKSTLIYALAQHYKSWKFPKSAYYINNNQKPQILLNLPHKLPTTFPQKTQGVVTLTSRYILFSITFLVHNLEYFTFIFLVHRTDTGKKHTYIDQKQILHHVRQVCIMQA